MDWFSNIARIRVAREVLKRLVSCSKIQWLELWRWWLSAPRAEIFNRDAELIT
jgi:hypothetical protein